jgi:hypothetical protein
LCYLQHPVNPSANPARALKAAPKLADHAIRRRFRAIRRFSIAGIQQPNDLSDSKVSQRNPNHHHEKRPRKFFSVKVADDFF